MLYPFGDSTRLEVEPGAILVFRQDNKKPEVRLLKSPRKLV